MKKWFLALILLLSAGYILTQGKSFTLDVPNETNPLLKGESVSITLNKNQIFQGDLLLVNKHYPVREQGVKSDVVTLAQHEELVRGYGLLDPSIQSSKSVMEPFLAMMDAAAQDGVNQFLINSGYRDAKRQNELYLEMGQEYALPAGYSEHNLGLSLDIGSAQEEMSRAPEGRWLQKHAWSHGFILRYPKDKSAVTGIQYEPWHFRYVGLPHSVIMKEKNLTLEEYLEYLKEHPTLSATVEGVEYQIQYYRVSGNMTIQVPAHQQVELSGNNSDGVIVTVRV
ncbi:hypothetical protein SY83_09610 [Paenibacillus swuensis]|uniref:D-alanyl-D-alanine carboxypeptidase-like core domain-containing protein n=1 Tax=Paenibacillus swuensis TaxID=1178515 RepID=A0A172THQ2_9BACL|nr:M15 family metallopeptidase [Paenibacillus swuensis]ANE46492.1 hypothetical protein SY83_09610 [Paenibacillus swuensis]